MEDIQITESGEEMPQVEEIGGGGENIGGREGKRQSCRAGATAGQQGSTGVYKRAAKAAKGSKRQHGTASDNARQREAARGSKRQQEAANGSNRQHGTPSDNAR